MLTTTELVHAAAGGDELAWSGIVDRYGSLVWSVARAHRLDTTDAADAVQTVWLRLVEHLDRIDQPEALAGWLATTTRRECLRLIRLAHRERPVDDVDLVDRPGDEPEPEPDAAFLARQRRGAVVAALRTLPERAQTLLTLLAGDPAPSYAEIAATLDMPIGSIGPTRQRYLARLRRALEAQDVAGPAPHRPDRTPVTRRPATERPAGPDLPTTRPGGLATTPTGTNTP